MTKEEIVHIARRIAEDRFGDKTSKESIQVLPVDNPNGKDKDPAAIVITNVYKFEEFYLVEHDPTTDCFYMHSYSPFKTIRYSKLNSEVIKS